MFGIMIAGLTLGIATAKAETYNYYENGSGTPITPFCVYDDATDDANCAAFEASDSGPPFAAGYCMTNDGGATWFIEKGTGAAGHFTSSAGGGFVKFSDQAGNYTDSTIYNLSGFLGTLTAGAQIKACWSSSGGLPADGSACVFGVGAGKFDECDTPYDITGDLVYPAEAIIVKPEATEYNGGQVPWRFATSVCVDDFPDENGEFYWEIEQQQPDTSWDPFASGTEETAGFETAASYADPDCSTGLTYGFGGLPDPMFGLVFPTGTYRIRGQATFSTGTGDLSAWTTFTMNLMPVGGGGGGSWGGDDAGGHEDWTDFFDGVPTHDDIYGACNFFSWDTNAGDGLDCLWSWIQYAIFPPAEATFDYISRPINTLASRWPFFYMTHAYSVIMGNITTDVACPMPELLGGTYEGQTLPTVDVCDWTEPTKTFFTSGDGEPVVPYLQITLWLTFIGFCYITVKDFFSE